jgi:hypothetical protein
MTGDVAKLKQRWSRRQLVVVLAVSVLLLLLIDVYRRHRRTQWLVSEVTAVGGSIHLPDSLLQQLWEGRWSNLNQDLSVSLGGSKLGDQWDRLPPDVDGKWLRDLDDLAGLRITNLMIGGTPLPGADVARLIERHPIDNFNAWELKGADDAARALRDSPTVSKVSLQNSDLTDAGFRLLPLEQLTGLEISRAPLTADGLQDLKRCTRLRSLWIDASQADSAIAALLEGQGSLGALSLDGPQITDEHLEDLDRLQLDLLLLMGDSVSEEAVNTLRAKLPECTIEVYDLAH